MTDVIFKSVAFLTRMVLPVSIYLTFCLFCKLNTLQPFKVKFRQIFSIYT